MGIQIDKFTYSDTWGQPPPQKWSCLVNRQGNWIVPTPQNPFVQLNADVNSLEVRVLDQAGNVLYRAWLEFRPDALHWEVVLMYLKPNTPVPARSNNAGSLRDKGIPVSGFTYDDEVGTNPTNEHKFRYRLNGGNQPSHPATDLGRTVPIPKKPNLHRIDVETEHHASAGTTTHRTSTLEFISVASGVHDVTLHTS